MEVYQQFDVTVCDSKKNFFIDINFSISDPRSVEKKSKEKGKNMISLYRPHISPIHMSLKEIN